MFDLLRCLSSVWYLGEVLLSDYFSADEITLRALVGVTLEIASFFLGVL